MKIALIGNQNSGKTTLFNDLTGSNQTIGNWPGVTIDRKEGFLKGSSDCVVVDLPGVYSLSPYTKEEEVSRRFAIDEKPDLIINIVDSTSLERSLYLTTQLLELDSDVVIALNMTDILEEHGITVDVDKLSTLLDTSIVPVSAMKETGIDELCSLIINKKYKRNKHIKIYPTEIENIIDAFSKEVRGSHKRFSAVKMIEDDLGYHAYKTSKDEESVKQLEKYFDMDGEQLIASKRYEFIEKVKKECVVQKEHKESITDKLDKVFLNKWAAIPIFILVMAFVYFISIGIVGGLTTPLIELLFNGASSSSPVEFSYMFGSFSKAIDFKGLGPALASLIEKAGGHAWSMSLVSDGIISGVAAVLSFLPQIMVMFLILSILETTGYMSRIAFFLDRIFHKFGLSGKSLIPFIVGTGCSVPGIMTCRIVEDDNERRSSIILTPFMPCSAKLPIIALFSSAFFGKNAWLVTLSVYFMAIAIILLFGYLFKKFIFKGEHTSFLSELPEYKVPKMKYVVRDVGDKTFAFIKKAGTIILLCSILVWFLSSFTFSLKYIDGINATIDVSILAKIGNVFAWFFYPMLGGNWSWAASISAIQGLVAKEQVVGSMNVIAKVSSNQSVFSDGSIFSFFNPWSGYAFLVFNLFSAPCIGALSAMHKELGSFKKLLLAMAFQISVAWIISTLIGCIGWMVM